MASFSDKLKDALIPWYNYGVSPIVVGVLKDWFLAIPRLDDDFSKLDMDEIEDHFTPRAGWYSGKTMFFFLDANRDGFVTEEEFVVGLLRIFRMKLTSGLITGASVKVFIERFQRSRKQGVRDRLRREKRQRTLAKKQRKAEMRSMGMEVSESEEEETRRKPRSRYVDDEADDTPEF